MENGIILNEKTYVLKGSFNKVECKDRFTTEQEAKIHKVLQEINKCYNEVVDCITEEEAISKPIAAMDGANVSMVIAKTDRAKLVLRRYYTGEIKIPELLYNDLPEKKEIKSMYSIEYLNDIMKFFRVMMKIHDCGKITMRIKPDFPMTIEDNDFRFILAPRVGDD